MYQESDPLMDTRQATCADPRINPELFYYPDRDDYASDNERLAAGKDRNMRAKAACALCPLRAECLAENFDDPFGVYGGLTPGERDTVRGGGVLTTASPTRRGAACTLDHRQFSTTLLALARGEKWSVILAGKPPTLRRSIIAEAKRRVAP